MKIDPFIEVNIISRVISFQTYPEKFLEKFRICEDLNICSNQLNRERRMAVAISRAHVRNSRLSLQTFCFEMLEDIHDYELKFLVRKDFPYLNELNEFIRMASANGLIENWHAKRRIRYAKGYNDENYETNSDSYKGIWMIYSVVLGFMLLTLYCERLIHKKARQPNPKRFWLIAEMIIDPNRHFWLKTKLINGNLVY